MPCPLCKAVVDVDRLIPLYTSCEEHHKRYARLSRTSELPRRPQPPQAERAQEQPQPQQGFFGGANVVESEQFMFMGFPGLGFAFNFGGGGNGGPRASFNLASFGVCIAMVLLSVAGEFFAGSAHRVELMQEGGARRFGTRPGAQGGGAPRGGRTPRTAAAAAAVESQWSLGPQLFGWVYTLSVLGFVAYAMVQRNRQGRAA